VFPDVAGAVAVLLWILLNLLQNRLSELSPSVESISHPRRGSKAMQFLVKMRDGSSYAVEAVYLHVGDAQSASYTLMGSLPDVTQYTPVAAFPIDLVEAIVPKEQESGFTAKPPRRPAVLT